MSVVVFGSINLDLVVKAPRLPASGETLTGDTFFTAGGGKGANQAVASARLGVPTRMIGRVGDDTFGTGLIDSLKGYGVDTDGVLVTPGQPSGVALITVNAAGDNTIVIIPGANGDVGMDDLPRLEAALVGAKVLLLQLEIPLDVVVAAARAARKAGVFCVLDPAPAQTLPDELYGLIDLITPNETEASLLTGSTITADVTSVVPAAHLLAKRGVPQSIIKLGSRGVYWLQGQGENAPGQLIPPFKVNAIDTVAAGDAFNGGLAAALSAGLPMLDAIRQGQATAALSTTKAGAQPSMPDQAAVQAFLHTQ
jgi:ribokinase